jgi:hypothetical protein
MNHINLSPNQRVGFEGELWAYEQLQRQGLNPKMYTNFFEENSDLRVGRIPIEVKLANPTWRKGPDGRWRIRWQFSVSTTAQQMANDWVLILIARDHNGCNYPYVVPGNNILNRRHVQITSHPTKFRGWLSYWLNRWSVIEYLDKRTYKDGGPLFDKWAYCMPPLSQESA